VSGSEGFPAEGMELTHLLVVADADRSRDWYRDVLGATVVREYAGTSCVLQLLGTWLLLVTGGGPTRDKPTVSFDTPADPDRVSSEMIFRVPDCQRAYEVLRQRGAEFLAPPLVNGRETRAFLRDPDGHLFEISEYRG
jgi:catechol 2,3-dioxygenase-like lactoylglutathione lyase family enzyme